MLVDGGRIVDAADDAKVVDCAGRAIVPVFAADPGAATFAVVPAPTGPYEKIIWWPSSSITIVVDGEFVGDPEAFAPAPPPSTSPHLGMWIDSTGFLHQELTADGRYDETRDGRRHAYRGSFQIDGDRIVYRDDLGFWAYGRFAGGVLHHAGYTLTRSGRPGGSGGRPAGR